MRKTPVLTRPAWIVRGAGRVIKTALVCLVSILCLLGLLTGLGGANKSDRYLRAGRPPDLAAEGFAEAFTRAYLTWDSSHLERHEKRVAAFASQALERGAGLSVPPHADQRVLWTATVRDQPVSRTWRLITVAAETSTGVFYYISVPVQRDRRGLMAVTRYPALVAATPVDSGASSKDEPDVEDEQLRTVARRAIANYLRGEATNLRADLDPASVVALPATRLKVASIDSVTWVRPGRVAVELRAEGSGATWTLRYELTVLRRERWYVRSIQANPTESRSR